MHPVPPTSDLTYYADQLGIYTDNSSYFIVRLQALFRFFSGGHMLVHIVLYNFLVFWGIMYIYGFCLKIQKKSSFWTLLLIVLAPSTLFWTSGMHKDGLELCAFGFVLYSLIQLADRTMNYLTIFRFLSGIFLMYEARAYVLAIFGLFIISYLISNRFKRNYVGVNIISVMVFLFLASCTQYLPSDYNIFYVMNYWQGMFMYINHGNSSMLLPEMAPSLYGLLSALPIAFEDVTMHPNIFELQNNFMIFDLIVNVLHLFLFCVGIYAFLKIKRSKQMILGMILLIGTGLFSSLFYGIIVSNLGALSRYRSVPILLLWIGYGLPISVWISTFLSGKSWYQRGRLLVHTVTP